MIFIFRCSVYVPLHFNVFFQLTRGHSKNTRHAIITINEENIMARIVILGAGLGGVPMAYEMKETVGKNHDVIVISDSPTFILFRQIPGFRPGGVNRKT